MAIKANIIGTDNKGSVIEAREKTHGFHFLNSTTDEKVVAIPTVDGVTAKYMTIISTEPVYVIDDANSGTDSLLLPNGGGAISDQYFIAKNVPKQIKFSDGSTHFHFAGIVADYNVSFQFYY